MYVVGSFGSLSRKPSRSNKPLKQNYPSTVVMSTRGTTVNWATDTVKRKNMTKAVEQSARSTSLESLKL